jgi:hypothetical protein
VVHVDNIEQQTRKILVVDDLRVMSFPATYARTSAAALELLESRPILDELWLDHDLGGDDTAMVVVDWLCERAFYDDPLVVGRIMVHTQNPPAGEAMVRTLARYYPRVFRTVAPLAPTT